MNIFKGTRLARSFNDPSPESNLVLTIGWIVAGVITVLVPLIYRTIHKRKYEQLYMSYYWEQEMEEYEKQRYENYQMYGNNYNYQGAYQMDESYFANREWVDVNGCRWWQLTCFSFYVNREGEPMEGQNMYPAWYSGWATSEEDLEEMERNREQPGSMKFVYVWQLFMFIVITAYGVLVIRKNRNPVGLIVALLVFANLSFCAMWLLADGSIVTDGYVVKRSGFYGQTSVLIFMSNFWYFLHGLVFSILFSIRKCQQDGQDKQITEANKSVEQAEMEPTYRAPSEEQVTSVQKVPPPTPTGEQKQLSVDDVLEAVYDPIEKACEGK